MTLNKLTTSFRGIIKPTVSIFYAILKTGKVTQVPLFRILKKLRLIVVTVHYKVLSGNFQWIILLSSIVTTLQCRGVVLLFWKHQMLLRTKSGEKRSRERAYIQMLKVILIR